MLWPFVKCCTEFIELIRSLDSEETEMTPHRWLIPVLGIVFGVIGHSLSTDSPGGVFCSADAFAADHKTDVAISYYRKEGGNTVDDGQSLPSSFDSKEGYLWRTPLASGHSTPCFAGDRIFLTTSRGEELATVSLYRDTGEVRWKRALPTTKLEEIHGSGSRATCSPASDGSVSMSSSGVMDSSATTWMVNICGKNAWGRFRINLARIARRSSLRIR